MKQSFFLILALILNAQGGIVNVEPERGRPLAAVQWLDESGRTRELSEFSGYPLVVVPIYTRCRGACVQTVNHLKEALAGSSSDPRQFRILLFSFDATDTPAILAQYREREHIPLAWTIGAATQPNIDNLLESIGTPVGRAGREFTHPNVLVFADAKLRIAQWIYGTGYSTRAFDRALQVAAGKSDWLGRNSDLVYTLLLFGAVILCVMLFQQLLTRPALPSNAPKSA